MPTQEALMIMDKEVQMMNFSEPSLSIDSSAERGFSLFYITFEGDLSLWNNQSGSSTKFKLSFMVEGKVNYFERESFVLNPHP
jgi:hypothetical protein